MDRRPRWGILGSGGICNDFVAGTLLKSLTSLTVSGIAATGGTVTAVGASSLPKAEKLAQRLGR